ncbi:MAG: hypothetical protein MJE68_15695, partial [Proteobacteria bacterium]|nr:hypothetical protein [Pseudomonadota bacterium]
MKRQAMTISHTPSPSCIKKKKTDSDYKIDDKIPVDEKYLKVINATHPIIAKYQTSIGDDDVKRVTGVWRITSTKTARQNPVYNNVCGEEMVDEFLKRTTSYLMERYVKALKKNDNSTNLEEYIDHEYIEHIDVVSNHIKPDLHKYGMIDFKDCTNQLNFNVTDNPRYFLYNLLGKNEYDDDDENDDDDDDEDDNIDDIDKKCLQR